MASNDPTIIVSPADSPSLDKLKAQATGEQGLNSPSSECGTMVSSEGNLELGSIQRSICSANSNLGCFIVEGEEETSSLPIPELGAVNHFSIELIWEEALRRARDNGLTGPIKVVLECRPLMPGSEWYPTYRGMAKKATVTDLKPKSSYHFRYKLEHRDLSSQWSAVFMCYTTREPLYAENLHMAIKRMDLEKLEEVLRSGDVNPNVQNEEGFTALQAAAKKAFVAAMEMLIAFGADVDYKNQAGKTALMVACTANLLESVQCLRGHNADYHIYDNGGCTAIHWAVDARSVKLLEWMATDGADFNIRDKANGGWTPLIRCANMHGDREVGLTLMMNGAIIDDIDNHGCTALHHAINRKHFDLTLLLMQRRADPLLPNKEQTTPWQIAQSGDDKRRIAQMMEPFIEEWKRKKKREGPPVTSPPSGTQKNNNSVVATTTAGRQASPSLQPVFAVQ